MMWVTADDGQGGERESVLGGASSWLATELQDEAREGFRCGARASSAVHTAETRAGNGLETGSSLDKIFAKRAGTNNNNMTKVSLWEKRSLPGVHIDTDILPSVHGRASTLNIQGGASPPAPASRPETYCGRAVSPGRNSSVRRGDGAASGEHLPPTSPSKKDPGRAASNEMMAARGCLTCRPSHGCNRTHGVWSQGSGSMGEIHQGGQTLTATPRTPASAPSFGAHVTNELYKTEMCRSWMETGTCRYGAKCQFAHGQEELRPLPRHPKYKTKICKNFAENGSCPYGSRCRFIHERGRTGSFEGLEPELLAVVTAGSCATPRKLPIFQQLHHGIAMDASVTKQETMTVKFDQRASNINNAEGKSPERSFNGHSPLDSDVQPWHTSAIVSRSHCPAASMGSVETAITPVALNPLSADTPAPSSLDPVEEYLSWQTEDATRPNSRTRENFAAQYWSWWSATQSQPSTQQLGPPPPAASAPSAAQYSPGRQELASTLSTYSAYCSPVTPANKLLTNTSEEPTKSVSTTWGSARSLWTALSTASAPFSTSNSATSSASSPSSSSSACLSASNSMNALNFTRVGTSTGENKSNNQPDASLSIGSVEHVSSNRNDTFT